AGRDKAIALAEKEGVNIRYEVADAAHFVTHESFDAIACIFFHLPAPLRQAFHVRIIHWLARNGHFILEAFTPNQLQYHSGGPKDIGLLMTSDMLAAAFSELHIMENTETLTVLDEGLHHQGTAAVVRFHGIKM
ncbi:MAG: hypothetical protein MUE71_02565, partial [Chitinophagaceae bacterium]|nr:hypothetical protein [Chitinophagaceae bacterium]